MLAPFALPLMAASAGISAVGAIRSGNMQKAAADREALGLQQAADQAMADGMAEDDRFRTQTRQAIGAQLASSAEAGAGLNEDQLRQSIYDAELDSAAIRYGVSNKARAMRDQAVVGRWQGRQARTAGYLNAAGTLLNAGATAGMYGMKGGKTGGSGGGLAGDGRGSGG
jgi:hypothetical protein